jgi:hypothetical protein
MRFYPLGREIRTTLAYDKLNLEESQRLQGCLKEGSLTPGLGLCGVLAHVKPIVIVIASTSSTPLLGLVLLLACKL